jgi:hypothetical protein
MHDSKVGDQMVQDNIIKIIKNDVFGPWNGYGHGGLHE